MRIQLVRGRQRRVLADLPVDERLRGSFSVASPGAPRAARLLAGLRDAQASGGGGGRAAGQQEVENSAQRIDIGAFVAATLEDFGRGKGTLVAPAVGVGKDLRVGQRRLLLLRPERGRGRPGGQEQGGPGSAARAIRQDHLRRDLAEEELLPMEARNSLAEARSQVQGDEQIWPRALPG